MSGEKQQFHVVVTKDMVEAAKPTLTRVHTLLAEQAFELAAVERKNRSTAERFFENWWYFLMFAVLMDDSYTSSASTSTMESIFFISFNIVFSMIIVFTLFMKTDTFHRWMKSKQPERSCKHVDRVMSDAVLHAPTEFVYEIKMNSYRADNGKFCNYKVIDCSDMEVVYRGSGVDCLCRKGATDMWSALVYHTSDEQRQAFDQLFERCGIEVRGVEVHDLETHDIAITTA